MTIAETFPELSKFIDEMPFKLSYNSAVETNMTSLGDYYDSLEMLFKKYHITHNCSLPLSENLKKNKTL